MYEMTMTRSPRSCGETDEVPSRNGRRQSVLGFAIVAIALAGLAAVAMTAFPSHVKTGTHDAIRLSTQDLDSTLSGKPQEESFKGSCPIPKDWCNKDPNREDHLSYRDCDGDGILDPYCEGGELLRFGYISSKNNCVDNWPHGICVREVEPGRNQGEFGNKAMSNEITIIHFNDVYEVAGILEGGVRRGGMSRAAHFVNQQRKRNPERTFVLFAGDALSPSVLSDLFEGEQMIDILNKMKIDAASLGNHEFDFGVDTLNERLSQSAFPWLNINLYNDDMKLLPGTTQRLIKEVPFSPRFGEDNGGKTTAKVCFFGVAYDVRETMFRDVVVPLTHQFSQSDCKLSKALDKDVDLILGGHDHSTEFTSVCGHAPYAKAASDLKTQWVMTLWLDKHGKVDSVDGRIITLTDSDPFDEDIHVDIIKWESKGSEVMNEKCGCSSVDLDAVATHVRHHETGMGNFFTDAVKTMHQTDVALINGGTIRGNKVFAKGDLTKKIMTEMHPFGNAVVKIYATGKELHDYITKQLDCYDTWCGNFVNVAGLKLEFNPALPKGSRLVKLMKPDGTEVGNDEKFTVALTDYMLANSPLKNNKLYNMVTLNDAVPLVQALFKAAKKAGTECVSPETDGRMKKLE